MTSQYDDAKHRRPCQGRGKVPKIAGKYSITTEAGIRSLSVVDRQLLGYASNGHVYCTGHKGHATYRTPPPPLALLREVSTEVHDAAASECVTSPPPGHSHRDEGSRRFHRRPAFTRCGHHPPIKVCELTRYARGPGQGLAVAGVDCLSNSLGSDSSGDPSTINASHCEGPPFEHSTYAQPVIRNGWSSASALRGSIRRYPGSRLGVCPKSRRESAGGAKGLQRLPSMSTGCSGYAASSWRRDLTACSASCGPI